MRLAFMTLVATTALAAGAGLAGCASDRAQDASADQAPELVEEIVEVGAVAEVAAPDAVAAPSAAAAALAAARFEKLKSLEGAWVQVNSDGETQLDYQVTANGSALVETVFPGQPSEMVSVYTLDSGRLVMTHYCAMGNQPYMVAAEDGAADVIRFECQRAGNTSSHADPHMHLGVLTIGADTLKSEWTMYADLTPGMTVGFDLVRGGM